MEGYWFARQQEQESGRRTTRMGVTYVESRPMETGQEQE